MIHRNSAILCVLLMLSVLAPLSVAQDDGYRLDMRDVDISEFIATVSRLTGKTIVVDQRVTGKITLQSQGDLSADELYELFLLQLGVSGFAVVAVNDNTLKVVPNQAAKIDGIEVDIGPGQPARSEAIITRVAKLKNVDVNKLIPTLRPLVDNRTGVITHYGESNIVVITDRASNVRRLLTIIEQVDRSGSQTTEIVQLQHASAGELERILSQLISENAKNSVGPAPSVSADARSNTLIIRGDSDNRQRLVKLIRQLDRDVQGNANIRVFYLKYAKAKDLTKVLASVSTAIQKEERSKTGGKSGTDISVEIEADEQTNAIVVSGNPRIISNLEEVVRKLDIRRAQVLVEAIIIELTDNRSRELGIQWLFRGDSSGTAPIGGINFGSTAPGIFGVGAAALSGDDGIAQALSGVEGVALGLGKITGSFSFATLMTALAADTESNILSTPSLLTLDNKEASILVGREVPIITGATAGSNNNNPFQTISRQDVGVKLTVTPQINEGNAIQLEIIQEVSSLTGLTASDIITNKRIIDTSVLVNDGATIVLGGLIDEDIQESTASVPFLGSLPFIGRLFRADRSQKVKTNLLVFIRPTIVRDQSTLTALSNDKYNYIRAQQLYMHKDGINLFPNEDSPVLPDWTGMDPSPPDVLRKGSYKKR